MREDHFLFVDLTSVLVINTHADGYDVKMKGKSLSTGCFIQIWVFIELYFAKFDTKSFFMNEDLQESAEQFCQILTTHVYTGGPSYFWSNAALSQIFEDKCHFWSGGRI